jgi:hypothetical protein
VCQGGLVTVLVPTSAYRLARPYTVRVLGVLAIATGVALLLVVLARTLDWPTLLSGLLLVLAGVVGAGLLLAAVAMLRPPTLLTLDAAGFSVRWPGGRGTRHGSWEDVVSVSWEQRMDQALLVLRHREAATTTLLLRLLDTAPHAVEEDVRRRLDAAYGYRPLDTGEMR